MGVGVGSGHESEAKRSPPPPPRMIAFMNEKNRFEYSIGGTGLILCYKAHKHCQCTAPQHATRRTTRTLSALSPFQKCSIFLNVLYGVSMSITPR